MPSILRIAAEQLTIFLRLELLLNFLPRKLILALKKLITDAEKGDNLRGPEKFVLRNLVAESLKILDKVDNLVRVLAGWPTEHGLLSQSISKDRLIGVLKAGHVLLNIRLSV